MLNELNSGGKLCDLLIGDSQWIGGSAESGHYVKLNDFFDANGIKMEDFVPATVVGYSEWPKNTPNYWALPAFGDVVGWTYRKDWFARPELQAEFKTKYGRELVAPATFAELKDIAEFFQNRQSTARCLASFTSAAGTHYDGRADAFTLRSKTTPAKPYDMKVRQLNRCWRALSSGALWCCPSGSSNSYVGEGIDLRPGRSYPNELAPGHLRPIRMSAAGRLAIWSTRPARPAKSSPSLAARAFRSCHTQQSRPRRLNTLNGLHNPRCSRNGGRPAGSPV
jgi:hypothetical protein